MSVLMELCNTAPKLLKYEWAFEITKKQAGMRSNAGLFALSCLFLSKSADEAPFDSPAFKFLFNKEKNSITDIGRNVLTIMCIENP